MAKDTRQKKARFPIFLALATVLSLEGACASGEAIAEPLNHFNNGLFGQKTPAEGLYPAPVQRKRQGWSSKDNKPFDEGRELRKCDSLAERNCFNPKRRRCRKKHRDSSRKYKKCLAKRRKKCCVMDMYGGLDEGEEFYEEIDVKFDGVCNDDLADANDVSDFQNAILEFSNEVSKCNDLGVIYSSFTLLEFEEADECKGRGRRLAPRRKLSKAKGQRKGSVCRDCENKRGLQESKPTHRDLGENEFMNMIADAVDADFWDRELGKKGSMSDRGGNGGTPRCKADLVESLNDYGFTKVTDAKVTRVEMQDCSKGRPDCKRGKACCGASRRCRCDPFSPEDLSFSYNYEK